MKIDFHCHIFYKECLNTLEFLKFQFKNFENYGFYDRIIRSVKDTKSVQTNDIIIKTEFHAENAGLDKVVLLPLSNNENYLVKNWFEHNPNLFIPFYNPIEKGEPSKIVEDIEGAFNNNFYKGLKIMLPFRQRYLNDKTMWGVWEFAENNRVPVVFHTGYPPPGTKKTILKYGNPIYLEDISHSFPKLKFVIAHMGYPFIDVAISLAVQFPNIYLDISNLIYMQPNRLKDMLLTAKEIIGIDKILYGSDAFCPEMLEIIPKFFDELEILTEGEIKKILGLNAKKLLKL
ncbi:MAG: amidohydrolase family protein [Candidatus Helarchaeota archaeon]